jgi:hypothetical protein
MPKVFTRELTDCRNCPNAVYDGSPWSGKGTDGAAAARAAGVPAKEVAHLSSNAAFCKELGKILDYDKVTTTNFLGVVKVKTVAHFRMPANCPLDEAGSSPAPAPGAAMSREQLVAVIVDAAEKLA